MQTLVLDSLIISLVLSGIPMVSIAIASGFIVLIQAATQVQEQSVIHLVRLITFVVVVIVAGDWAGGEIVTLFERSLKALESVGESSR